ncbi:hypothetical protein Y032_0074g830 [Ancylostoma ceylanicum]|uniref:Mos1 transposase HTH domain-containing protein n=1 Tax=Ancylostoma ceylanicum TaxID=53326 RepID=A0A016TWE5_9BILA|nr:hypothetical protein Y032_0074g830 [Ancylostoma ceylanicum]
MTYRKLDERIRISLWYEYKLGHSGNAAYENLVRVYGPSAIAQRTVWKWYKKFRAGNEDIDRKASAGVSTTIDDNELEDIVKRNPEISRKQLAKQFGVAHSTIYTHLDLIAKGQKMKYAPKKIAEPTTSSNVISDCLSAKRCFTGISDAMEYRSPPNLLGALASSTYIAEVLARLVGAREESCSGSATGGSNNPRATTPPSKPSEPGKACLPQSVTCLVYPQGEDLSGSLEGSMKRSYANSAGSHVNCLQTQPQDYLESPG